jgi:NTE family protein
VSVAGLLDLAEPLRELVVEITRREPIGLPELTAALGRNPAQLELQVHQLLTQGWLEVEEDASGEWTYRVQLVHGKKPILPPGVWQVLDDRWQVPIFRLFPDAVREEFSRRFRLENYRPGTVLYESGTWGEQMYVVERGRVELVVRSAEGEPFVVREVSTEGVFGEMAVLLGERRPCAAHVVEDSDLWTLSKADLDSLLAQHPMVGLTVRRELARHLRSRSGSAQIREQHSPALIVGDGGSELARSLAEQTGDKVTFLDLVGKQPELLPNLSYIDVRGLHSQALGDIVDEGIKSQAWVLIAALPEMIDQLLRVTQQVKLIIDATVVGAPWLRAAGRQYWAAPSHSSTRIARTARRLCGQVTGLVLSGGLARTIAHLGVLDVLNDAKVPIDAIASCGYAGLWSVLYAAGWPVEDVIELVIRHAPKIRPFGQRLNPRATSRSGLFDARAVRSWIQGIVGTLSFSELETPCSLVVNNVLTGENVSITEDHVFNALSACVATPGLVRPVNHRGQLLVDATLSDPLPASALSGAGVDLVLASSVIPVPSSRSGRKWTDRRDPDLVTSWLSMCDTVAHQRSLDHLNAIDVLIAPDVAEVSDTAFEDAPQLIERGRQAARQALPRIRTLLGREE